MFLSSDQYESLYGRAPLAPTPARTKRKIYKKSEPWTNGIVPYIINPWDFSKFAHMHSAKQKIQLLVSVAAMLIFFSTYSIILSPSHNHSYRFIKHDWGCYVHGKLWAAVTFCLHIAGTERTVIQLSMREWEQYTCLKFVPANASHENKVILQNGVGWVFW